ncbi:uncharacterized protein C2845_PM16G10450 [Panicum miliaceum]|uniref:Uncharacterized protein n=1 Tax=Panicum miliaceum TaxID=4540 RepID=A0A3L6PY02_PANMI|nr:uncharacterized protein C2845_PM16G10450 [Panicum miliaceum]
MTKQKIVIRVSLASEKTRSKAMALVAKADGVSSMGVTGDGRDQLEVVGDGVDTVCLVQCLRKKIGHAEILKVEEMQNIGVMSFARDRPVQTKGGTS